MTIIRNMLDTPRSCPWVSVIENHVNITDVRRDFPKTLSSHVSMPIDRLFTHHGREFLGAQPSKTYTQRRESTCWRNGPRKQRKQQTRNRKEKRESNTSLHETPHRTSPHQPKEKSTYLQGFPWLCVRRPQSQIDLVRRSTTDISLKPKVAKFKERGLMNNK